MPIVVRHWKHAWVIFCHGITDHGPRMPSAHTSSGAASRIDSKLLLAQPYSPHLFRQGILPGPHLLRERLAGRMSREDGKAEWKRLERKKSEAEEHRSSGEKWPFCMELACRLCTDDNGGEEVRKPLSAFTSYTKMDDIWKRTISQGQDLVCLRCSHQKLRRKPNDAIIPCDHCNVIRARKFFNLEMQQAWQNFDDLPLYCKSCTGEGKKFATAEMIYCVGCEKSVPEYFFEEAKLTEMQSEGADCIKYRAKCAKCVVTENEKYAKHHNTCQHCQQLKQLKDFSAVNLKQWLTGARTEYKWGCYECLFPQCAYTDESSLRCRERPIHAIKHNALVDGKYYCLNHRYPPCSGPNCTSGVDGEPKRRVPSGKIRFKPWRCEECRQKVAEAPTISGGK